MAEYIEREAVVMGVLGLTIVDPMVAQYADAVLRQIQQATAADVVPVVHGRWIEKERWSMGKWHKWLECSRCGHQDHNLDMYEDMPFTSPSNYCPNCGARMDGE